MNLDKHRCTTILYLVCGKINEILQEGLRRTIGDVSMSCLAVSLALNVIICLSTGWMRSRPICVWSSSCCKVSSRTIPPTLRIHGRWFAYLHAVLC